MALSENAVTEEIKADIHLADALLRVLESKEIRGLAVDRHASWFIYRTEEGKFSVSQHRPDGKQESEEIYEDPRVAIRKFLALVRAPQ